MKRLSVLLALCSLNVVWAQESKPAEKPKEAPKPQTTLECLLAAYEGETNAHVRYTEFAKRADEEGYAGVASLFRAAAKAEKIHAENHAAVIKELGGNPAAEVKKPEVKTTKENLEAALKGETYERDTMYPEFLKIAQSEKNKNAVKTFQYAKAAETEHAKLYKEALDNLAQWKGGKRDFFVCLVCGNTVTKVDFEKCPVCFSPNEKYEKVN